VKLHVEGTQCIRAAVNSVVEIMKFLTTNTLTGADVLRDVEKLDISETGPNLGDRKCLRQFEKIVYRAS
jgi:hypothetical protein